MICLKFLVILYNFIFWLTGVLILGLASYLWWDSQNYLDTEEISTYYMTPFVALLLLGALMTLIGFLGCCGAFRESRCLLAMYVIVCLILCILSGAFLFWTLQHGEKVRERIKLDLQKLIHRNYGSGNTNATEMLVDRIQRHFSCCGVMGPEDWVTSGYNNKSSEFERGFVQNIPEQRFYRIPRSCCLPSSDMCENRVDQISNIQLQSIKSIQGLNIDGCMKNFESFIQQKWYYIVMAGIVLVSVQVFALVFAFCLCCAITRVNDEDDK